MNLLTLAKENIQPAFRFELQHPVNGEGLGAFISVVSAKSPQAEQFMAKRLKQEQLRELENAKSRKPKVREYAELKTDTVELAINRIVGWENIEWGDKKDLPFTEDNARMLLTECDWIIEQVLEHSNDLGKFLKSAS